MLLAYFLIFLYVGGGFAEALQSSHSEASAYSEASDTSSSSSSYAYSSSKTNLRPAKRCQENSTYKECPSACPTTCESTIPMECSEGCLEPGCECNPGYVLNKGRCIQIKDCPGAKSCTANETFVACKAGCPTDYCPQDDGRYFYACDIPWPCPSGCVCQGNYLKLNYDEPKCILASECPPVTCTRQNEEWNPCPSICLAESCSDLYGEHEISECQKNYPHYCNPKCTCKKNYYRNATDDCVPSYECPEPVPVCGDNEEAVKCRTTCPPQNCDIAYTDYACPESPKCEPGCDCIQGYLRNQSGICIPSDKCFAPSSTCDDENASYTDCLSPCPATCEEPIPEACKDSCAGVGCACNSGYVLNEGRCVELGQCPGASECSVNQTYVACKSGCPTDYCPASDTRQFPQCSPPYPCRPGCICEANYLISNDDNTCILASECPPVECTRDNEVYDSCPSNCKAETCQDLYNPNQVRDCSSNSYCRPACVCKENYYRDDNDNCVPSSECGSQCQGRNASYTDCLSACPATCDNLSPQVCPAVCRGEGCKCNEGYVLDNGNCIAPEDCPKPICNENEHYTECLSACPATCEDPSPDVCTRNCVGTGCACDNGYVSNDGKCILPEDCPAQDCDCKNATYTDCLSSCPATCDNPSPEVCTDDCNGQGCECNPDYVSNNGNCILPEDCPKPICNENEHYTECLSACPATCEDPSPDVCTRNCVGTGCACDNGYVSNDGKCILPEDCPNSKCNDNSTYTNCLSACPATCDNSSPKYCILSCNGEGCACKKGYVLSEGNCILPEDCPAQDCDSKNATYTDCLSSCPATCDNPSPEVCTDDCNGQGCECNPDYVSNNGNCILPEDCPNPICNENAHYTQCLSACPATCEDPSPDICTKNCVGTGCTCDDGYVSNDGKCILPEDCPTPVECTRDNEVYDSCPSNCKAETCQDLYNPNQVRDCSSNSYCRPACVCKENYYRDDNDNCVPSSECGSQCQGRNASYTDCLSACPATCDNLSPQVCPAVCRGEGCKCNEGYVLDNGNCIAPEDCPKPICNENEHYTECLSACPATCEDPSPDVCTRNCVGTGCACDNGYVSNDGKCILPEDCPAQDCDCKNATYTDCLSSCPATCDNPSPEVCTDDCNGQGCECNPDYVSNNGNCILPEDCPKPICNENEHYTECLSACPATCEDPSPDVCTRNCVGTGCACDNGYVSNDGKCILPEDCPNSKCNDNSTYTNCLSACPATCDNSSPKYCILSCNGEGCACKKGYVLSEGNCILPEDCPAQDCDSKNATYTDCLSSCPATCDNPSPEVCTDDCNGQGCECNPDYVSNNGNCILPEDCPNPICNENAHYTQCLSACPATCEDPSPDICTKNCVGTGCTCDDGYVSNDGKCILPEDCPNSECNDNSTYSSCLSACPATCDDPSPKYCTLNCNGEGCACKEGYVLNDGVCILPEDCPKPTCDDENASYNDCLSACPPTCDPSPEACIASCVGKGCSCNPGYVSHEGRCILFENCPGASQCSYNETYVYCNAGCPTQYCPRNDIRAYPLCSPPYPCPPGCACKKNYLRSNYDNSCILSSECPPVKCTRPNEEWDPCPSNCKAESCDDFIQTNDVSECEGSNYCRPRCMCKKNYYRNDDGDCVPARKCPQIVPVCGYNEEAVKCKTTCPPQNCNIAYTEYLCSEEKKCEAGCDCIKNHLRNSSDVCIFNEECPLPVSQPECGPNEELSSCKITCPPQSCESIYTQYLCADRESDPCEVGCNCKDGYLRNSDGVCIPSEQCPGPKVVPVCGYNEEAVECRTICPPQNCDIAYTSYLCSEEKRCEPGCDCIKDHLRNSSGVCILNEECPPAVAQPECGPNEELSTCKITCPPQSCASIYTLYLCAQIEPNVCEVGCNCKKGYLRNSDGVCIPSEQCPGPKKCPVEERCRPTCAVPNPKYCDFVAEVDTNDDGGQCKSGYILSEAGGKCIKVDECPTDIGCNGDEHAVIRECPAPCPSTCDSPNQFPCKKACTPIGCECASGYILSEIEGKCIMPNECTGGNPCGPNGTFTSCRYDCPTNYCPVDDNQYTVICEPTPRQYCLSGCRCNLNNLRLSREDRRCIAAYDCPPVNCTRPNEVWNSCPSACLAESCESVDEQPAVCNTLIFLCNPKCVCKDNFSRDSEGFCIPNEECRELNRQKEVSEG